MRGADVGYFYLAFLDGISQGLELDRIPVEKTFDGLARFGIA